MSRHALEEAKHKLEELQRQYSDTPDSTEGAFAKKVKDLKTLNQALIENATSQEQHWKGRYEKAKAQSDVLRITIEQDRRQEELKRQAVRAEARQALNLAQESIKILTPARDAARSFLSRLSAQRADAATLRAAQLLVGQWDQQFEGIKDLEKAFVRIFETSGSGSPGSKGIIQDENAIVSRNGTPE